MSECVGRLGKWFGHRFQVEVVANSSDHVVDLACTRCGRRISAEKNRCADGSLVHDFKGQPSCPACGLRPQIGHSQALVNDGTSDE